MTSDDPTELTDLTLDSIALASDEDAYENSSIDGVVEVEEEGDDLVVGTTELVDVEVTHNVPPDLVDRLRFEGDVEVNIRDE